MNKLDEQYLELAKDILKYGVEKETRSGKVISVFGRQIRHKMSDGFPLLTTKKMFTKGIIYELLWFIKGDTNIRYLIENNVHIWDDDAYRWYCKIIDEHNDIITKLGELRSVDSKTGVEIVYSLVNKCTKEEFLSKCLHGYKFRYVKLNDYLDEISFDICTYGDLGPIYGKQWRKCGYNKTIDQLQNVINTLLTNPNDRRLIVNAWIPNDLNKMALPPCHYSYQFYTRQLTFAERIEILKEKYPDTKIINNEYLDELKIPKYELSLMWNQRSCDYCLGIPYNITSYGLLLSMIAQCVNMTCGEIIGNLGDVHIYKNHIDGLKEQLEHDPYKLSLIHI